ncbi:MAG: dehydro coenzyme reductase / coenzyme F420-0:L-glutamate ligase / coenzyme [Acidimicrobiaceae bacterium]|nr:dehydro coenzyme reductase / coenzyme F420-0:L-glutamate ligase / coenzyme [Acidimicrobiaceae bacterium]
MISLIPVLGVPEIHPGDVLADVIARHAELTDGDVVVVTQKIVSKAEGRLVPIDPEDPNAAVQAVLDESVRVLRQRDQLFITETRHGFVCANSGVDLSNVERGWAALLPLDPDRSARRIRDGLRGRAGVDVAVIVSDTFGRPWRHGLTDVAIGCAGIAAILDLRGGVDTNGRELHATEICIADEIAGAAELVMGKSSSIPVAIVRGVDPKWLRESSVRSEIVRNHRDDLFR